MSDRNSVPSEETLLAEETLDLLGQVSTATLTTQLFARGLRNTFLPGLRAVNPARSRMVGEAFTLRYIPAREDIDVLSVFGDYEHPQRRAVELTPQGNVLVVDSRGDPRAASAGSILLTRLAVRGAAGFVTDGGLRDWEGIAELDLPVFGQAPVATTNLALHHAVDLQVPIGCGGVPVYPGDVMVSDLDGVVCVPRHLAAEVAEAAAAQEQLEGYLIARVRAGSPLRGTYPPDAKTRAAYEETIR